MCKTQDVLCTFYVTFWFEAIIESLVVADNRAMAGNKSIGENYSFSGVHHIFDQHKEAGLITAKCLFHKLLL